jgi:glycosyltransferase involved in cell wall biosynthesis
MKVTIATRIYAPETAAASFRLSALADALVDDGCTVTVLTSSAASDQAKLAFVADKVREGIRVRRSPVIRDRDGYVRGYLQYLSFDIPLFFRLLFARRSDVVVVEPPPTTGLIVRAALALRRTPYVYYAADVWSDAAASIGAPHFVIAALRRVERNALRGAGMVIAVSDGVAERVRAISGHDRVKVVRNGIDTNIFTPEGPDDDGPPLAVYAGTMSEWQGADVFVRAWPQVLKVVPDARLVFAGGGTAREQLRLLARDLSVGASVSFPGVVSPEEAARLLRSARVGLVSIKPDQGYDFAVPTKLFASAACGTPVLFAGQGAACAVVAEANLGTTPGYDVHAVAGAMTQLLTRDREEVRRLGDWVQDHASIVQTGRAASSTVLEVARAKPRRG